MSGSSAARAGAPAVLSRQALVLFDQPLYLSPGQEWHSNPFALSAGDDLTITCRSDQRFYAGLFDKTTHDRLIAGPRPGAPQRAFPFRFGTDQVSFDRTRKVTVGTDYIVVVRRGVYSQAGPVQVRITRTF
jgi:hypothetical protein